MNLKINSQISNSMIYYQIIFRSVLAIDEKHSSLWLHIFPGDGGSRRGYWLLSVMGGEFEKSRDICTRVSDFNKNKKFSTILTLGLFGLDIWTNYIFIEYNILHHINRS